VDVGVLFRELTANGVQRHLVPGRQPGRFVQIDVGERRAQGSALLIHGTSRFTGTTRPESRYGRGMLLCKGSDVGTGVCNEV
jgi:hypothetical protein